MDPAAAAAAAAAASKSMRTTPQPVTVGVPVSLTGGLTIGRSSSPARGQAIYQTSGMSQRVLTSAEHAGQVRHYLPMPGTASASPFANMRDVRDPAAYLRGSVSHFKFHSRLMSIFE